MSERESNVTSKPISDEEYPEWMKRWPLGLLTEEEIHSELSQLIRYTEIRALRQALWILLKHRFPSLPRYYENCLITARDPERLLTAFKKALTIEKIEDLHI